MKILRLLGLVLLLVVLLVVGFLGFSYVSSSVKIGHKYTVQAETVAVPTDPASIAEGDRLTNVFGCRGCHGDNLGGKILISDPAFGRFVSPNLTAGSGGVASSFKAEDWVRALRHGVKPDGTPILIMPCDDFYYLSDRDLGCILASLAAAPPVNSRLPGSAPGPIARVLLATGQLPVPADAIGHGARPEAPEPAVSVAFGRYEGHACLSCHGRHLEGGPGFGGLPPPNLTPAGALGAFTEADFEKVLRHGITPDGRRLNPEDMPWIYFSKFNDTEVRALWAWLKTVPPVALKKS